MQKDFSEDIGHSSVLEMKKMVWNVLSQTRRKMWQWSRSDDQTLCKKWSFLIPRDKCAQTRNLEEKRRKKYDTLHSGISKHRTFTSHNSLGKSAQYLRSSIELVWWVCCTDAWSDILRSGQIHFKSEWSVFETAGFARSWFFGIKPNDDRGSRG